MRSRVCAPNTPNTNPKRTALDIVSQDDATINKVKQLQALQSGKRGVGVGGGRADCMWAA